MWNLRPKTPYNQQATVPWHQDNAYLDPSALYTHMPTAWIPLIDANRINGCMQVRKCIYLKPHNDPFNNFGVYYHITTVLFSDDFWRAQAGDHSHTHMLCWGHMVRGVGGGGDGEESGSRHGERSCDL